MSHERTAGDEAEGGPQHDDRLPDASTTTHPAGQQPAADVEDDA